MNRLIRACCFLLCFALIGGPIAPSLKGEADSADKAIILKLENEWLDTHDRGVLDRILADDFLHPVPKGVFLTKAQDIDFLVSHPNTDGSKSSYQDMNVRIYGDTAVVRTIINQADRRGTIRNRRIATDIFIKRKGRWQAISTQDNVIPLAGGNLTTPDQ